jgi:gamma-aminobutyric acid type B receptor
LIGAQLAVDVINRNQILPGYRLVPVQKLSRCVEEDALDDFFGVLQSFLNNESTSHPMFIVGAGCSVRSQPVAHSVSFWNMIQVAYSSGSPLLSNRVAYPNFFRLTISSLHRHLAQVDYVNFLGYSNHRVGLILQDHGLFTGSLDTILEEYKNKGINLQVARFSNNNYLEVEQLFERPPRMFVLNAYEGPARKIFCMALEKGLTYPNYAWIIPGWYGRNWWKDRRFERHCSNDKVQTMVKRSIAVRVVPRTQNQTDVLMSPGEVTAEYERRTANVSEPYDEVYSRYAYDAVWVVALAINKSLPLLKEEGLTLEDYHLFTEKGRKISEIVRSTIQSLIFTGVSGNVSFKNESGDRIPSGAGLSQYRMKSTGDLETVHFADIIDGVLYYRDGESNETVFKDGPPKDDVLVPPVEAFGVISAFAVLATALSLFFVCFSVWHRKKKTVKATSPVLNVIVALGSVVWYTMIVLIGLPVSDEDVYNVTCPVTLWMLSLGVTLVLGPLTLKSWRIYHIFHNPKPNKKVLKTWMLLLILWGLIVLDVCVLTILTGVPDTRLDSSVQLRNDGQFYFRCGAIGDEEGESTITFVVFLVAFSYKSILALLSLFFAFQTRNIKLKILRESRQTSAAIFVFLAASILYTIAITFLVQYPDVQFILLGTIVIAAGMLINGFIFLPKVFYHCIVKRRKGEKSEDESNIWSGSEEVSNLHRVTLASMQNEIDSLKHQLARYKEFEQKRDSFSSVSYEAYENKAMKHRLRSVTWSVTPNDSLQYRENLLEPSEEGADGDGDQS